MRNRYVWAFIYSFCAHIVYGTKCHITTALSAGALLVLPYLPGHPPYYELAASIAAKTYSNAMMAVLNSRVKGVSNVGACRAPLWNEWVHPLGSVSLVEGDQGIVFRKRSETSLERLSI